MDITKKEFDKIIKPFIDKVEQSLDELSEVEFTLIGDYLLSLMKAEKNPKVLLERLSSITGLKKIIAKKHNLYDSIETVKKFLEEKNSSQSWWVPFYILN